MFGDDMVSMSEDDRSRNVEGRAARKVELVLKCPGTLESGEEEGREESAAANVREGAW